jgi:glycosyltransferase involved in cell wall biosynthesis
MVGSRAAAVSLSAYAIRINLAVEEAMHSYPPYLITHVHLEQQQVFPLLTHEKQGHYLVFWWKGIALGHLFVEPDHKLTKEAYWQALVTAIAPAIQQYATKQLLYDVLWQQWLIQGEYELWMPWMEAVFLTWLPVVVPEQVPVTAIICTRNRALQLRRCLQMLYALSCAPAEIVVVDNAPSDTSTQEVVQEFAGVVYIREPRAGLDIARNTGIRAAQFPVVTFVDDDVVVHPMLLFRVWETFQEPTIAAMTGLVIALSLETEAQLIFEQCWSFNRGYVDKMYTPDYVRAATNQVPRLGDIGAGANMAFRKSIFEDVGYFHEMLDVGAAGCSGDAEMWHRILLRGYSIRYAARAIAYHEHRRDIAGLKHQLYYYMRGHVVAALIQQKDYPQANYSSYLYFFLPKYYAYLVKNGLPFFHFRSQTLWAELKGVASGFAFYYRIRNRLPASLPNTLNPEYAFN